MDTLSTHFYSIGCLAAQLLDSLVNNNTTHCHAIASELAASEESSAVLFKVLCLAWWLMSPDHPLQSARHNAFLENNSHGLFCALIGTPAFTMPPLVINTVKTTMTFKKALAKRNIETLYAYTSKLEDSVLKSIGIADAYLEARRSVVFKPLEDRILYHATAALVAFPSKSPQMPPWSTTIRGKSGRLFNIEPMPCAVWGVKPPPPVDLIGNPHKLIPNILFETQDLEKEIEFYQTQFPDDIPDEWTAEEISKSHLITNCEFPKNVWRPAFYDCF